MVQYRLDYLCLPFTLYLVEFPHAHYLLSVLLAADPGSALVIWRQGESIL